jgi:hypothetical protein
LHSCTDCWTTPTGHRRRPSYLGQLESGRFPTSKSRASSPTGRRAPTTAPSASTAAWENATVESDGARRLLFEKLLIPLFKPKDNGGSQPAIDLGIEYLPRLARKQPTKSKTPLGNAVVRAVGEERAGTILGPLGYKVSQSGSLSWRRTKIDTS